MKRMNEPFCIFGVVIGILSFMTLTPSVRADLMNGDFSDSLNGWDVDEGIVEWFSPGVAKFSPDNNNEPDRSTLSQQFEMNDLALNLSFDFVIDVVGTNGGESDIFKVELIRLDTLEVVYSKDWEEPDEGSFPHMDTFDVSSLAGKEVKLIFDLDHDYSDFLQTTVSLDKVAVSLVPAPGAVLLGILGLSAAGLKLRKFA